MISTIFFVMQFGLGDRCANPVLRNRYKIRFFNQATIPKLQMMTTCGLYMTTKG